MKNASKKITRSKYGAGSGVEPLRRRGPGANGAGLIIATIVIMVILIFLKKKKK